LRFFLDSRLGRETIPGSGKWRSHEGATPAAELGVRRGVCFAARLWRSTSGEVLRVGFTYIEERRGHRDNWVFQYKGADLALRARVKAVALLEEERGIERALAACKAGDAYSGRKEDIARFRQRLKAKGEERERCELLARELERAADLVFELGLGDLVYFGMDEGITASGQVVVSPDESCARE
jgi:hypothetical protein